MLDQSWKDGLNDPGQFWHLTTGILFHDVMIWSGLCVEEVKYETAQVI